jgi:hypothetical protein
MAATNATFQTAVSGQINIRVKIAYRIGAPNGGLAGGR